MNRRTFLAAIPAACLAADEGKGRTAISKPTGYADAATEFAVIRLTDPAITSLLPANFGRVVSKRGNFLLFSCDATGRMEVYRLDYRTGEARQLTEAAKLQPLSVTLTADERGFAYVDGDRLALGGFGTLRARDLYKAVPGFELVSGFTIAEDNLYAAVVERKDARHRLRLIRVADGAATTLAEADEPIADPIPRPRRASVLYRRGAALWLVNYDGQQNHRLKFAEGEVKSAIWSPDGRTVFYLHAPADRKRPSSLRELTPDSNDDKPIAETSQFAAFSRNADASVFVGASASKASPHVLLLVRAVRRELTLAEHRASDPALVSPVFAPNSRRIFFNSDLHGKPAIYSMQVDKLVEETAEADEGSSKDGKQ